MKKFLATVSMIGLLSFGMGVNMAQVFAAVTPSITSITPSSGTTAGGTSVTIVGQHLVSPITVIIGGNPATNVVVANGYGSLTAMTPAGTAGAKDVTVVNSSGTSTLSGSFIYVAPPSDPLIVATAGANGSISPSGTSSVVSGGSQSFAITPNTNFHIADVLVDNVSVGATSTFLFSNVTTDHTISATFAANTFTLEYAAGANGTLSGSSSQVVSFGGSGTPVTAVPNSGFQFVNWSDASTTNPRTDTNVTGNLSLTANFSPTSATSTIEPCNGSTFDTFATGTIAGQGGWSEINTSLDQAVVSNTFGYATFGCKSLRMSNASTSPIIWTQVFTPTIGDAGESTALNGSGVSGTTNNHFEGQFDIASTLPTEQPGMHLGVSPDRGPTPSGEARMSALTFADASGGIDVFFTDVTGTTTPTSFNDTQIASSLSRATPHTIKYVMDFVEGASNDVVKVFIDGVLAHTGTSWENFYRFDTDSGTPTPNQSRTVNSLAFFETFATSSANLGKGFLIDDVSLSASSTATTTPPVSTSTTPIITLNGSSTMNVLLNSIFTDPGATALSGTTTVPVVASGTVDTSIIGTNVILYTATGTDNSVATTTRTVNVVSTSTPPIIILNGSSTMSVTQNDVFTDPGATAVDVLGVSVPVVATGTVNTSIVGANTITYTATDARNNVATTTRTVNVVAAVVIPPVTPPSNSGGGGGGGISNGGSYFIFSPTPGQPVTTSPSGAPIAVGTITTPTGQVLGVATFNFTRNLKYGQTGDDVMELQKILIAGGDLILNVPTKFFGKLTQKALMKWQKRNGLPSTGFFGPLSRARLTK